MLYLVTCYHVYASLFRSFAVSHTTHWTNHSCILRVFHHSSYICCGSRLQYILLSCTSQANKQSLTVTHWTHQFVKCVMVRKVAFHVWLTAILYLNMTLTVTCTTKIVNMTTFQQNYTASTCTHEIFQICKFMVQCSVFTFFTCPGTAHLPATWRQCTKYVQQPVCGPLLLLLLLVHQLAA